MRCSGRGLEWGRHIAVEDRRPTCIFRLPLNPQSPLPVSLGGPLTALSGLADWQTGSGWHTGQVSGCGPIGG